MSRSARLLACALALSLTAALAPREAHAQFGGPPPPQPQKPKADPNQPETHAASGSGDESIPKVHTSEPQLPPNPTEVSDTVKGSIGTSMGPDDPRRKDAERTQLKFFFPYVEETTRTTRFRTVFPLWAQYEKPGETTASYGLLYYKRRSAREDADVVFPFYWRWREGEDKTTIIGPAGWHTGPKSRDNFFLPFWYFSRRTDGYTLTIPPLLTHVRTDAKGGRAIAGPAYCFWRGGQTCNPETADSISFGVFPFYFASKDEHSRYELAPLLLHYYSYDELDQGYLDVWGPYIRKHGPKTEAQHVAPFFFHVWGPGEDHITIPPLLFHYGHKGNAHLLVTPFFVDKRAESGAHTFVTWGYARHRGRTELDMITPFYWRYSDPDVRSETKILFPFLYSKQSPRESTAYFFPFYGHRRRYSLSETWWVTPFFEHTRSITGWETNLYPLVYLGRDRLHSHTVVAPFFFDFVTPESRSTVGFPVYWRFSEGTTVSQVVLNTYYREKKLRNGTDWEFHLFPLFSYGQSPNGHFWNVLYGLAGYTRSGAATTMRLLWIPVELSQDRP